MGYGEMDPEMRERLRKKKWTGEPSGQRKRTEWQEEQASKGSRGTGKFVEFVEDQYWQEAYERWVRVGILSTN